MVALLHVLDRNSPRRAELVLHFEEYTVAVSGRENTHALPTYGASNFGFSGSSFVCTSRYRRDAGCSCAEDPGFAIHFRLLAPSEPAYPGAYRQHGLLVRIR